MTVTAQTTGKIIYMEDGDKTSLKSYHNLDPEASDSNIAGFLNEISKLQGKEVKEFQRTDTKVVSQ